MISSHPGVSRKLFSVLMLLGLPALGGSLGTAAAQDSPEGGPAAPEVYRLPPRSLIDIVDAPRTPRVNLSPGREWMLILESPGLPTIDDLSRPELRLAGVRIDPRTNGPSRDYRGAVAVTLVHLPDLVERKIQGIPAGAEVDDIRWSPDGSRFAFTVTDDAHIEIWVAETERELTKRVIRQPLNGALGIPYRWFPDGKDLLCAIIPEDRGPEPEAPRVPTGPVIQETSGQKAPARTYQDLLEDVHDEELFTHYFTSQLLRVSLGGSRKRLGEPGIFLDFTPSPDGSAILVERIHPPYSYLVPYYRFPRTVEVWDPEGNRVAEIADVPLQETVPTTFGSVPTGPRSVGWRSDAPATLAWVEAQDGGDASVEAEVRDRVFALSKPFAGTPEILADLGLRFGGITWGTGNLAMVEEWWWKTRRIRTWRIQPDLPGAEPYLVFDRSFEDRYGSPGDFVTRTDAHGERVLHLSPDGSSLFLFGEGASPEGNRPFIDRMNLADGSIERLWRSEAPYYEEPVAFLGLQAEKVITRREAPDDPPNYFVRTLDGADTLRTLTTFPDPTPQFRGIYKEIVRYTRKDGVKLSGTLYLPPGRTPEDGPLPMLVWAYPREYKSADAAGQITDSPYRFNRVEWWSPLVWLAEGYAVLQDPKLPIVGEGEAEPNDTYVEQLVAGAEAAVDEMVRRGVAEPGRIAIGGHSYGAFMAANLLAHSDLFATGIARSGAYNRTLTPFGFQAEERTVWQAPEVYFQMSPFLHADRINEPILLIHGELDNNPGTFPLQSERFYAALKGLGATARLVMLPRESHGYRARESVLHVMWETSEWLHRYLGTPPAVDLEKPDPGE